jgi:hypothetical protein
VAPVEDQHCFRWEVVNSSKLSDPPIDLQPPDLTIHELIWPVAGIRVLHIPPGERFREFNNLRDRSNPAMGSNPVFVFEGTTDLTKPTQSWIPTPVTSTPAKSANYDYKRTGELLPGLKASTSILNSRVAIISFGEGRAPPGEISQVVGFGELELRVLSHVTLENNIVMISTNVAAKNIPSPEVRFSLPAMRAMQQVNPKAIGDIGEATEFLNRLDKTNGQLEEANHFEWAFRVEVPATGGNGRVFRVHQPVVVSLGESRHCYLVRAYSAIPVGLTVQNCW